MVTTWPKHFPGQGTLRPERFARTIAQATDGRLEIEVYGAGEIVPAFERSTPSSAARPADARHALLLAG
jgi:TRAP-type mannitol/chloroaromatic compound transport system substrate-binding protein